MRSSSSRSYLAAGCRRACSPKYARDAGSATTCTPATRRTRTPAPSTRAPASTWRESTRRSRRFSARLRKIAAEPVPADELEKARGYSKGRFVLRLESPQGTIQYGLRREVLEGEIEDPDELIRQLDAVTVEDVQRVAKDLFEEKRLYLALVGPFDDPDALREAARRLETVRTYTRPRDRRARAPAANRGDRRRLPRDPSTSGRCFLAGDRRARERRSAGHSRRRRPIRSRWSSSSHAGGAWRRRDRRPAVLRLRHRRRASRALRRGLAHHDLGPDAGRIRVLGPSAAVVEEIAGEWLKDSLGIPPTRRSRSSRAAQMAHVTALAAARHDSPLARRLGCSRRDGLTGAPPSVSSRATRGTRPSAARSDSSVSARHQIVEMPPMTHGRHAGRRAGEGFERTDGPTIVCAQAGEVNTGSVDPVREIAAIAAKPAHGCTSTALLGSGPQPLPALRHLLAGFRARGFVGDRCAQVAQRALRLRYRLLAESGCPPRRHDGAGRVSRPGSSAARDEVDWTPESSRRARGFTVYAALRSLGRRVSPRSWSLLLSREAVCRGARSTPSGCELLNDVVHQSGAVPVR